MKCNLERKEYVQVSTISARCLWNVHYKEVAAGYGQRGRW